jgi:ATP synthase protein I
MTERNRKPSGQEPALTDLKARLRAARAKDRIPGEDSDRPEDGGVGIAVRVGVELAGTLAVGVGIGWALDKWLGTGPWFMVVFFFLGATAGILNVYRAVKNIGMAVGYQAPAEDKERNGGTQPPAGRP